MSEIKKDTKETKNSDASLDKEFQEMQEHAGSTLGETTKKEEVKEPVAVAPETKVEEKIDPPVIEKKEEKKEVKVEEKPIIEKKDDKVVHRTGPRPENYIPMKKFHDTKRDWEKEKATLVTTIAKSKGFVPGSEEEKTAVAALVEKTGLTEDVVRQTLDLARQSLFPKELADGFSKILKDSEQEEEKANLEKAEKEESEFFNTEYTPFSAEVLDKTFPNATEEQKEKARTLMDVLSHTPTYAALGLDEVFAIPKNRKQFDEIFAGTVAKEEKKEEKIDGKTVERKGPESSKNGGGVESTLKASDFKKDPTTKRYDFTKLHEMPESEEKQKLISALEPEAYVAYGEDLGARENNLEIRRGGERVILN